MKNLARFLGIAALAAAMAFVALSCKEDPPSAPPPKAIFDLSADYGAYPSYPITATVIDLEIEGVDNEGNEKLLKIAFPDTAPSNNAGSGAAEKVVIFWVDTATADIYKNRDIMDETAYIEYLATLDTATFNSQVANTVSGNAISTEGRLFKPGAAGDYAAGIVSSRAFEEWSSPAGGTATASFPQILFSNVIKVKPKPTPAEDPGFAAKEEFFGKWSMNYGFEPADMPGAGKIGREIVKIGPDTFRLFLNQLWVENGEDKGYQGIQFEIARWDAVGASELLATGELLKGKNVPNPTDGVEAAVKSFKSGFKLTLGKELVNQGYTTYKSFYVFQDYADISFLFLVRTNESGRFIRSYLGSLKIGPTETGIMTEDWTVTGKNAPKN